MRQFNRVIKVAGKPGSRRFAHLLTFEERREREDMIFEVDAQGRLMESLFREAAAHVALEDEPEGKPEVVN